MTKKNIQNLMVSITNKILGDLDQQESDLIHVPSLVNDFKIPGGRVGWTVKQSEVDWGDTSVLRGKNES